MRKRLIMLTKVLLTTFAALVFGFFLGTIFAAQTVAASQSAGTGDIDDNGHFPSTVGTERVNAAEAGLLPLAEGYHVQFESQNDFPTIRRGESYNFDVTVRNVGTETWKKDVVHLGTDRGQDRITSFLREDLISDEDSGWVYPDRITWAGSDETVEPGETATFSFWMSAPYEMALATYQEYFRVVADGVTWMEDLGMYWDVTVTDGPSFAIVSQNDYPETLTSGKSYEFVLVIENTSSQTWVNDGNHPLLLGTDQPRDRVSGFLREDRETDEFSGWVGPNRVQMEEDEVDPGEEATFRFWYTVPETMESGTYKEYFRPLLEQAGWLDDYGVYWEVTVANVPVRPATTTLKPEVNKLIVSWAASAEATGYRVRYRPLDQKAFTILDVGGAVTETTFDAPGGQDYEVGVAAVDDLGPSPFTSAFVHVESQAEADARVAAQEARQEQVAAQERKAEEERRAAEEPEVIGAPAEEEPTPTRDWRQFWLTLLVILGAAGLATAGYYGYEWWAESRRRPRVTTRVEPPKRETPPKPPSNSTRW